MNTTSSIINLEVSDGSMAAFVSRPNDEESHPAVIVIQEIFGVNANIKKITETFAAEGYISVAPDLFHRSGHLLDVPYSDMDTARNLAGSTTPSALISDLETVVRHLQADPFALQGKLGITGYCFGGRVSFLAATSIQGISAAAIYYGGGIAAEGGPLDAASSITAPIIGFFGENDQNPSPDDVNKISDQLKSLGKTHEFHSYAGAGHGFMCEDRGSYNEAAAADAWEKTRAFFSDQLA